MNGRAKLHSGSQLATNLYVCLNVHMVHTCTPGCFLTDLTSADRVCRDRGFANTLPVPSGAVCYSQTTAGSEAVYICDDGFHQDGAATRVCQSGGVWNGSTPQCLPDQDGKDGI